MIPSVTAIITTYKREWKIIERAIRSIQAQYIPVHEILIVDDNPDGSNYTKELKEGLTKYPDVLYYGDGCNRKVSRARNLGVSLASGDYVGFLDDDDEWMPSKMTWFAEAIEQNPDAALIFGKGQIDHENGELEWTWPSLMFNPDPTYQNLLFGDYVGTASNPFIRRDVFLSAGGFLGNEVQPAVEDYELWIRIAKDHLLHGVDADTYRKHMPEGEHVSMNWKKVWRGYENIYFVNKEAYDTDPAAKERIIYNIARAGIFAKDMRSVRYVFKWFGARIGTIGKYS